MSEIMQPSGQKDKPKDGQINQHDNTWKHNPTTGRPRQTVIKRNDRAHHQQKQPQTDQQLDEKLQPADPVAELPAPRFRLFCHIRFHAEYYTKNLQAPRLASVQEGSIFGSS